MYWLTVVFSLFCLRASLSIHSFPLPLFFPVDLCVLLPTPLFHSTSFSQLPIDSLLSLFSPVSLSLISLFSLTLTSSWITSNSIFSCLVLFSLHLCFAPPHCSRPYLWQLWCSLILCGFNPPLPLLRLQHTLASHASHAPPRAGGFNHLDDMHLSLSFSISTFSLALHRHHWI